MFAAAMIEATVRMSCEISDKYLTQLEILKKLFGADCVTAKLDRLNQIYKKSEEKYADNLKRLRGVPIRYLLLAESPPWTESGEVQYFYDTFNKSGGQWCSRIWKSFFPDEESPEDIDTVLTKLAKQGFLLIDTLPFAMEYSSGKRKKKEYKGLVKACLPYLMTKINNPNLSWDSEVKVAFAFKLNGLIVMEALNYKLIIPDNQLIELNEKLIAADGAGFTSPEKLRSIFRL